ncbi:vacuolar protein sorting-associated protein VTA1 homolog [Sitodiplosis mosellana]|uniref:vacuolar protein sorting-associated protein VTA1 homolog n=1 Tax=Sitodiplosis mosellana TaxID=263140 RepID=UPI002443DCDB|nr:vacuolar protein sorting-associated protein VTA1 homolog [Sitodiplosis mosellana]
MANFPAIPQSLKPVAHFLKTAQEHDGRDPVVSYWCRYYALQSGLKLSTKQPEETALFLSIMDWLEQFKKEHHDNEAITNDVVAQAYLENYAMKLFTYADQQDRASNFNKNVVKAFYTAGVIADTLLTFGELSVETADKRKYAKYKAAYIHTCLKNGEMPVPGPPNEGEGGEGESDDNNAVPGPSSNPGNDNGSFSPPQAPADDPEPPRNDPSPPPPHSPIEFKPHPTEINADKLPSPPIDPETKNPGGFQPYVPTSYGTSIPKYEPPPANVALTADQMAKAQKYCKYAGSALNFDDVKAAIDNLEKALHLLTTGKEKA